MEPPDSDKGGNNPRNSPNENITNLDDGIEQESNDHGPTSTTTPRQSFPDPDKNPQLTMAPPSNDPEEASKSNEVNGNDPGKISQLTLAPGNPQPEVANDNSGDDALPNLENNATGNSVNDNIEARPGAEHVSGPFASRRRNDNDYFDLNTYAGRTIFPEANLVENINKELRSMLEKVRQNLVRVHGELNERFRRNETYGLHESNEEEPLFVGNHYEDATNDGLASTESPKHSRVVYFFALMVCLVPIAVAVGIAFLFDKLFANQSSVPPPARNRPAHPKPLESLADRLDINVTSLPADSAASLAFEWMTYSDTLGKDLVSATDNSLRERYAVVVLYFATNGPSWKNRYNFLSGTPVCTWNNDDMLANDIGSEGIYCNDDDEVVSISLGNNTLSGSIPPELGFLSNLLIVDLVSNQLTGAVPTELGLLTALQRFDSGYNQLTGTVPTELGLLLALTELWLDDNQMTGTIPPELHSLPVIRAIFFGGNMLTGPIPPEFGLLTSLIDLYIGNNRLTGTVPSEFGSLTSLEVLSLYGNGLNGTIPTELGSSTGLKQLRLSSNDLTGAVPSEVGLLSALEGLSLSFNRLAGVLPSELGLLTELIVFCASGNQVAGTVPSELGFLTVLEVLDLAGNRLTSTLPTEFGLLTALMTLYLGNNEMSGTIPSEFGSLTTLEILNLWGNGLRGTIPSDLGLLGMLVVLDLGNNRVSGTIPSEFGLLTTLERSDLAYNRLTGTIPSELGLLSNLRFMSLWSNGLTRTAPSELNDVVHFFPI